MAPNDHVEISIDSGEGTKRWSQVMKKLKTQFGDQFQSHEDDANNSQQKLLHEKLVGEKKVLNPEVYEAVKEGNVDKFVDVVWQVCEKNKLRLSNVFDHVTWTGDSLVHLAAHLGKEEIVMLICQHFHNLLTMRNTRGDTSLHVAARANNHTIVKFIVSHDGVRDKMITRETNEYENTPLHEAVICEHFDAVKELVDADPEVVHCLNKSKHSPLYLAVVKGNIDILNLLLQIPFPKKQLPHCLGNSPLHAAILEQKPDLMRMILEKRPELVYFRDEDGGTPLHYAAYIGYAEGFDILLANSLKKSDVTPLEENNKGHLPIHLACKRGHVELVQKFFQHKWDFNPFDILNKKGQNILHVAANNGKVKVVQYLLKNYKIDYQSINQKDNGGNTPLHLASKRLFPKVLHIIVQHKKINKDILNDDGLTARDVVEREKMSIRKFLASRVLKQAGVPLMAKNMLYSQAPKKNPEKNKLKDLLDTFLVVATLMVTVTFAAAFTVPGGVYSSGDPNQGMAIFAHRPFFWVFTTFNMVAMYSSVIACGLMLMALIFDYKLGTRALILAMGCLLLAFLLVPVAFMAAVRLVVANNSALATVITVIGTSYTSLILFSLVGFFPIGNHRPLLKQIGRLVLWALVTSIDYDIKPEVPSSREGRKQKDNNKDKNKDN